ncbi:hypothetical protein [Actinoplanes sp. NPDC026623]|uniref:hypothetical protein n=1 Tax=Actinoplanes sp. NPDC026623 TaxID=3155610 RepID=UPI00340CFAA8
MAGDTNGNVDAFVHDRETGATTRVSVASDGAEAEDGAFYAGLSANGRYVTFISGSPRSRRTSSGSTGSPAP